MSSYPEHDKLAKVSEQSQAAGELLDWLTGEKNVSLCRYLEAWNNDEPRYLDKDGKPTEVRSGLLSQEYNPAYESRPEGFYPIREGIQDLLAEFFGIDRIALEAEKRQMLNELREVK